MPNYSKILWLATSRNSFPWRYNNGFERPPNSYLMFPSTCFNSSTNYKSYVDEKLIPLKTSGETEFLLIASCNRHASRINLQLQIPFDIIVINDERSTKLGLLLNP